MPTSYTSLLGLALPVTGELAGQWGTTVNDYITQYVDSSVAGTQTISGSQTAVTLSVTNGSSLVTAGSGATGSAQFQIINCTGNPAGLLTITAPASSRQYIIINATSTSQSVKIVGSGPTTGVTLIAGEKAHVAWNGSDFVKIATTAAAGGSNTQVQYNSSGVLAGSSNMTFDGTNLTVGGTASATKLIPTGGSATGNGMYLPAANSVAITTNGAQAIYIDSTQNVGIGTSSPGQLLTLSKATTPAISFVRGTGTATIGVDNGGSIAVGASAGDFIIRGTGTTGNTIIASSSGVINAFFSELGNLGLGVTPSAWGSVWKAIQIGSGASIFGQTNAAQVLHLGANVYFDSSNTARYIASNPASRYRTFDGAHEWYNAPSGTAGDPITFTQAMTLDASGRLMIGTTTPQQQLTVSSAGTNDGGLYFNTTMQNATTAATSAPKTGICFQAFYSGTSSLANFAGISGGKENTTDGNASGVLTFSTATSGSSPAERMRIDSSGNLGLGVTPSAWNAGGKIIELTTAGNIYYSTGYSTNGFTNNAYYSTGWKFANPSSARATYYEQSSGTHAWAISTTAGTAGNAITFTQAMTLDASGNLGVGTTNPVSPLTAARGNVTGAGQWASSAIAIYNPTNVGSYSQISFGYTTSTTNAAAYIGFVSTNQATNGYGDLVFGTRSVSTDTQPTERARITSGGDFGIGTTSPNKSGASKGLTVNGSVSSALEVAVGDSLKGGVIADANAVYFSTRAAIPAVFEINGSEKARITSGGDFLVGTTSSYGVITASAAGGNTHLALNATSGDALLRWVGAGENKALAYWTPSNDRLYMATGTSGGVYLANGGTSWTSASDERVKDIIEPIENASQKIFNWRAVVGKYKTDEEDKRRSFLIAQDVLATFPEAVDTSNKEEYGIRYQDLIPVLVKAIQEQQTIIQSLTARIAALESKGA